MARKARIHIYLGTLELPKRDLNDQEFAHDVIEIDIGDRETVKEVELEKQRATYRRRLETEEEVGTRLQLAQEGAPMARAMGFTLTHHSGKPQMVNERVKDVDTYRYRIVTLEEPQHIEAGGAEEVADAIEISEGDQHR